MTAAPVARGAPGGVVQPRTNRPIDVVAVAVDVDGDQVVLQLIPTGGDHDSSRHLHGHDVPVGAVAALEGWCASATPLVLEEVDDGALALHGPTATVAGLHRREDDAPAAVQLLGAAAVWMPNTSSAPERPVLRVRVDEGRLVHLAPPAPDPGRGRSAVRVRRRTAASFEGYDIDAISQARWARWTYCGRPWLDMADASFEVAALTFAARLPQPAGAICPVCTAETVVPVRSG